MLNTLRKTILELAVAIVPNERIENQFVDARRSRVGAKARVGRRRRGLEIDLDRTGRAIVTTAIACRERDERRSNLREQ
jgi:hypothetical protein